MGFYGQRTVNGFRPVLLALEEFQQMLINYIRVGCAQTVRSSGNNIQLRVLDDLCCQSPRIVNRHNLIRVTLNNQQWHLDLLEVLGLIRLRKCLDAIVSTDDRGLHAKPPERFADTFRNLRTRLIVAIERKAQIPEELGTVVHDSAPDIVENRKRKSTWILVGLQHQGWDSGDQYGL